MDRSDIELLKILRHYLPQYMAGNKNSGICGAILGLLTSDILTADERSTLDYIIINNRPPDSNPFDYFWPKGEIWPRMEFLDKLIKKYENDGKDN